MRSGLHNGGITCPVEAAVMSGRCAGFYGLRSGVPSRQAAVGRLLISAPILKQFPGYHLLTLQERDPYLKGFLARHFPKANPSVVHADFDGDGHEDYALLLKNDKLGQTMLVVVLCLADGQCKKVYELDEATYAAIVYLSNYGPRNKGFPDRDSGGQHFAS